MSRTPYLYLNSVTNGRTDVLRSLIGFIQTHYLVFKFDVSYMLWILICSEFRLIRPSVCQSSDPLVMRASLDSLLF